MAVWHRARGGRAWGQYWPGVAERQAGWDAGSASKLADSPRLFHAVSPSRSLNREGYRFRPLEGQRVSGVDFAVALQPQDGR
jgi:hypothetical protein